MHPYIFRLRDIFIDERRSHSAARGPLDHQAAIAMGNSLRAWQDYYDKNYTKRECQAGIEAMFAWRSNMLARSRGVDKEAPVQGDDIMIDLDDSD